jgi:hypothetical protein
MGADYLSSGALAERIRQAFSWCTLVASEASSTVSFHSVSDGGGACLQALSSFFSTHANLAQSTVLILVANWKP